MMVDAVERFANDLRAVGAGPDETAAIAALYERALTVGSTRAWTGFYRATFWVTRALAGAVGTRGARSDAALASLRLMLEDDLGITLFADELAPA